MNSKMERWLAKRAVEWLNDIILVANEAIQGRRSLSSAVSDFKDISDTLISIEKTIKEMKKEPQK